MNTIKNFFYPGSVCIVGASSRKKSIGYEIVKNIKEYGYKGKLFPVNPKVDEILSYKCYHSIDEIEEEIDLAIIVVPKNAVEDSIESLLRKNVKSIILITAGFKETGTEGEELENRIIRKIKDTGARVVGPNCMGVRKTHEEIKLNATFVAEKPERGSIGFLSQSGALGAAVLNSLRESDIKFAHFVSIGNKADVNENDIIELWQNDKNIQTIVLYLESFSDGERLIKNLLENKITKPVMILKAGRTKSGIKAAISHTGALSSEDKIVDAVLKQFGIIRADNLNELFNTAKGFENFPIPVGNKVAIVTNAGGPAILCVDRLEKEGLILSSLSVNTKQKIKSVIHPEGSAENPIDLLPNGDAQTFKKVIEILLDDENVDSVISIFVEPVMVSAIDVVEAINSLENKKPIFQVAMPLPEFWKIYREKSKTKKPVFRNPEDPPEVISNMIFYSATKRKIENRESEIVDKKCNVKILTGKQILNLQEIEKLCNIYNLPFVESRVCHMEDLNKIEENFFPLVIKGINKEIIHKTEVKAVILNVKTKDELFMAASEIQKNFIQSNFEVEEFLIQKYIKPKFELLIGCYRDLSFGPIIMFGSGGKYVEIFDDVAIKSCYLFEEDIQDMIESTKIGKILKGVRNEKSCDLNKLIIIIRNSARMMLENPEIIEFDINPLIVDERDNFYIVDFRVKTDD